MVTIYLWISKLRKYNYTYYHVKNIQSKKYNFIYYVKIYLQEKSIYISGSLSRSLSLKHK